MLGYSRNDIRSIKWIAFDKLSYYHSSYTPSDHTPSTSYSFRNYSDYTEVATGGRPASTFKISTEGYKKLEALTKILAALQHPSNLNCCPCSERLLDGPLYYWAFDHFSDDESLTSTEGLGDNS